MKTKRFLSCIAFLLFVALGLPSCQNNAAPSGSEDSSLAIHVHAFAADTYPCQDRVCLICGKTIKASEPHALKKEKVVEPTCETAGYTCYVCERCGYETKKDPVAKLGHDFVVESESDPTCSTVGIITKKCTRCGAIEKDYKAKKAHVFDESKTVIHEPTCTHYGYTSKVCSVCGEAIKTDYREPLGHTPKSGNDVTIQPTCTKQGYTTHLCARCGETYQDTFVKALGHDFIPMEKVAATCEHSSYVKQLCSRCGEERIVGGETQKKAHRFGEDGICLDCGKDITHANVVEWSANGKPVPMLSDTKFPYLVYADPSLPLEGHITQKDADLLRQASVSSLALNFGNPDTASRLFEITSNTGTKRAKATALKAIDRHTYGKIALINGKGEVLYGADGLTFTVRYNEETPSKDHAFALSVDTIWAYDENRPASYLIDVANGRAHYEEGKGYVAYSTNDEGSFIIELDGRYLQKNIENGKTTLVVTFLPAFLSDTGDPLHVAYDFYAYQKGADGVAMRKQVANSWIHGGKAIFDAVKGTYTHEIDLSDHYDFKGHNLEMNFSTSSINGNASYQVYLAPFAMK